MELDVDVCDKGRYHEREDHEEHVPGKEFLDTRYHYHTDQAEHDHADRSPQQDGADAL